VQKARYADVETATPVRTNAEADGSLLESMAAPDEAGRKLLQEAAERMRLSARGYFRVLRVARTLADLDGAENVTRIHIAEAVTYRRIVPGRSAVLMAE
jgi:magnesium chelatase family protein